MPCEVDDLAAIAFDLNAEIVVSKIIYQFRFLRRCICGHALHGDLFLPTNESWFHSQALLLNR